MEYWLAVYRMYHGDYRLGALVFDTKEACETVAKRENFIKAISIQFDEKTGSLK